MTYRSAGRAQLESLAVAGRPSRWLRRAGSILLVATAVAAVAWCIAIEFQARLETSGPHVIGEDAITYRAAGERLNEGRPLYAPLQPGDRQVILLPGNSDAPIISPPLVAVIWRPLAALGDVGFWSWVIAAGIAVASTVILVLWRAPVVGSLLVLVSAPGIAQQLAVANVAAFFAPAVALIWIHRHRTWVGSAIGVMASLKLAPIVLAAWLIGTRRWSALVALLLATAVCIVVSVVGAGIGVFGEYLDVARYTVPSLASLSGLTGIPAASYLMLAAFALLSVLAGRRDGGSFAVADVGFTFFTPAFYVAAMVTIPPLALVSLAPRETVSREHETKQASA